MSAHREFAPKLTGAFGFPIMPMNADPSLDYDGLARLVDWMTAIMLLFLSRVRPN